MESDSLNKLYKLLLKKTTYADIATIMGCDISTVQYNVDKYFPYLKDIDTYKEHKLDIFQGVQSMAIEHMVRKMPHASFKDLVTAVGIFEDKISPRESGTNIALSIRIEDIVAKKERIISNLRERGIEERCIETEFQNHVSLPSSSNLPIKEIEHAVNFSDEEDTTSQTSPSLDSPPQTSLF